MAKTKEAPKKLHHWVTGEKLQFHPGEIPSQTTHRDGEYVKLVTESKKDPGLNVVEVKLKGDPFTICVYQKQIEYTKSPNETESEEHSMAEQRLTAKELRRQAKQLGIEGWEEMGLADLREAVAEGTAAASKPAKKTTAKAAKGKAKAEPEEDDDDSDEEDDETPAPVKKAPAKKTAAKKAAPAKAASKKAADDEPVNENGNPFAQGTNLYEIAELLIVGGKRSALVKKLKRKIDLKPRTADKDWDEDYQLDRRLLIVGQLLRKDHGFNVVRDGRGADATIVAEPPA